MSLSIAFLGLGAMGRRMADRLVAAGHAVTVWNRSPAPVAALLARHPGVQAAATPAAAARGAAVVVSMLADDAAAAAVWQRPATGALAGLAPGALCLPCGTLRPGFVQELAAAVAARGGALVEAPVAGSTPQAEAGQLRSLLGGAPADVERARAVVAAWSGAVVHAGPVGAGATLKLMVNGLFTVQVAALAELFDLARARGLAPEALLPLLAETPVCSPAAQALGARMLAAEHPSLFPVRLVEKDLGYVVEEAGGPARAGVAEAARQAFAAAAAQGWADADLSVLDRARRSR